MLEEKFSTLRIDIQKLKKIPTLSYTAEKILNLTSKESTHLDELLDIIEKDPPIMSKILGIANIIYFGMYKPITSVKDALLKIGFKTLRNVALSVAIFSIFKTSPEREQSYKRLFGHSIATGSICQFISEKYAKNLLEDAYTVGVLHDLGLFVLHYCFYDHFNKVEKEVLKGIPLYEAEKNIVGSEHTEIGKWIADFWGLPEIVSDCIFYHHESPFKSEKYSQTVALVHLANFISEQLGFYMFQKETNMPLYLDDVYKILKLPEIDKVILEIKDNLSEIESL